MAYMVTEVKGEWRFFLSVLLWVLLLPFLVALLRYWGRSVATMPWLTSWGIGIISENNP